MEILLAVSDVITIMAKLCKAISVWLISIFVTPKNDVIGVTVLHLFTVPLVQRDRILMLNIQKGSIFV